MFVNTYEKDQDCNNHTFRSQPTGFPFRSMVFDGSSYVDARIEVSKSTVEHYSLAALVYITGSSGMLFHYKADQANREVYLMIHNRKLKLYRKVRSSSQSTYNGNIYLALNTWYFISLGVGSVGYVYANVNESRDIYGTIGLRNSLEIPGNLRIGGDIDGMQPNFQGRLSCVAFHWFEKEPTIYELQNLCTTTPWMRK